MHLLDLIFNNFTNPLENVNSSSPNILQETPITNENWKFFVFLIVLSTLFLLGAVIVYILLWDKQNLAGWTQLSYLLSFLLFNVVFIPALCPGLVKGSEITTGCFLLSVANQFFFICSKSWLLIIGFDILWNLWKFELANNGGKHLKRLTVYSVLGWVLPAIFVGAGVALNFIYRSSLTNKIYEDNLWTPIPDYGHLHCRIPNWSIWEIFVFSNCILHFFMFSLIIFLILKHRYNARDAIQSSTNSRQQRQSIILFIKLFFVVGLSWSYIALQDLLKAGSINTHQNWGWQIFRIIYFLQGVFISLIYICNVKTVRSLEEKYPRFKKLVKFLEEKMEFDCCPKLRRESFSSLTKISRVWTVSGSRNSVAGDLNNKPEKMSKKSITFSNN